MGKLIHLADRKKARREAPAVTNDATFRAAIRKVRESIHGLEDIRRRIPAEAKKLGEDYYGHPSFPEDFNLRFARIAYAMYLLDILDSTLAALPQRADLRLITRFGSALKAAQELLDEGYFSKSGEEIFDGYSRFEKPLRACTAACRIRLLMPEPAVERFKMRLADIIEGFDLKNRGIRPHKRE